MPSRYTLESLPQPTDKRVQLHAWIEGRGLEPVAEPVWAGYDRPFMPWFLRRNEILIEVRAP